MMLHYFAPTESSFCQIHADSYSKENKEASVQAKIREGQEKLTQTQIKKRVEVVLDQAVSFRIS